MKRAQSSKNSKVCVCDCPLSGIVASIGKSLSLARVGKWRKSSKYVVSSTR